MLRRAVDIAFACVLLAAGFLKVAAPESHDAGLGVEQRLWIGIAVYEALLAVWLMSGLYLTAARSVAVVTLAVFTVVSGAQLLSGKSSCGCFGALAISPATVFALDVALLIAFLLGFLRDHASERQWALTARLFEIAAGAGVVSVVLMVAFATQSVLRDDVVVVEPVYWVGQELPLLAHIVGSDDRRDLATGHGVVILVNHDCPSCQEHLAAIAKQPSSGGNHRIWVIDIANPDSPSLGSDEPRYRYASLRNGLRVVAHVPWELRLEDGVVRDAVRPNASIADPAMTATGKLIMSELPSAASMQ